MRAEENDRYVFVRGANGERRLGKHEEQASEEKDRKSASIYQAKPMGCKQRIGLRGDDDDDKGQTIGWGERVEIGPCSISRHGGVRRPVANMIASARRSFFVFIRPTNAIAKDPINNRQQQHAAEGRRAAEGGQ